MIETSYQKFVSGQACIRMKREPLAQKMKATNIAIYEYMTLFFFAAMMVISKKL